MCNELNWISGGDYYLFYQFVDKNVRFWKFLFFPGLEKTIVLSYYRIFIPQTTDKYTLTSIYSINITILLQIIPISKFNPTKQKSNSNIPKTSPFPITHIPECLVSHHYHPPLCPAYPRWSPYFFPSSSWFRPSSPPLLLHFHFLGPQRQNTPLYHQSL